MVNLMLPVILGVVGGAWLAVRAARQHLESGNSARVAAILTAVAAPIALAALSAILTIFIDLASPLKSGVAALTSGVIGAAWLVCAALGARVPDRLAWLLMVGLAGAAAIAAVAGRSFDPGVRVMVTMVPVLGFLAIAPTAAARAFEEGRDQRTRWAAYGVGALMALAAVGALPVALFGMATPPQEASHAWEVQLIPQDQGDYTVRIHMLEAGGGVSTARLKGQIVDAFEADGARAHWENGTLVVAAAGPVKASASTAFFGSVGDREGFPPVRQNVTAAVEGPAMGVLWRIAHSGGEGHSCLERGVLAGSLPAGGHTELRAEGRDELAMMCV